MHPRKSRKLALQKTIHIYCEGETEENYFKMLKQKYGKYNVSITRAKRPKIQIKAMRHSGEALIREVLHQPKINKNDQIYVVFDRDEHSISELEHCRKLIKNSSYNIHIMFSSICFEIWILMHFEPVFRSYEREELFRKLSGKKYFNQDYKNFKGADSKKMRPFLIDHIQFAKENADKLYRQNSDFIHDDPFTNINLYLKDIFQVEDL